MTVRLPAGKTLADGPFPTLIEYSGYQTAAPHDLLASIVASLTGARRRSPIRSRPRARTAVGVARSPRCSASPSSASRCAARAARAARSTSSACPRPSTATTPSRPSPRSTGSRAGRSAWPASRSPASRSSSSAGTRPPHLAAITPMSVTDDLYTATGFPGGIRELGLRRRRGSKERMDDARPAPVGGQPWAKALVKAGDRALHRQPAAAAADPGHDAAYKRDTRTATPSLFDQRSPGALDRARHRPDVPRRAVPGRADRRALPRGLGALKGNPQGLALAAERRPRRLAGADDDHPLGRVPEALRRRRGPGRRPTACSRLSGALYSYLADAGAAPVQQSRFAGHDGRRGGAGDVRAGPARAAADGQRRRPGRPRLDRRGVGARLRQPGRVREAQATTTSRSAPGGDAERRRGGRRRSSVSYVADPGARPSRRCPATARATRGRRSRRTTGRRSRRARASGSRLRRSAATS